MCQLCSIAITGCDTCDDATICITCLNPTYIKDGGICKPCNLYQPYCLNCTEMSPGPPKDVTCQVCMSYYGLTTSNFCALCSSMIPGCQLCLDITHCTKCLNGWFINQTSGKCIEIEKPDGVNLLFILLPLLLGLPCCCCLILFCIWRRRKNEKKVKE
jgi:hypothetical protein